MTADIAEFLTARLDDEERLAEAAIAATAYTATVVRGMWEADEDTVSNPDAPEWIEATHPAAAAHIARQDPRATLDRVAALRAVVAMHRDDDGYCSVCAGELNDDFDGVEGVPWPCPTLRALASAYRRHPEFDESWAMEVTT